MSCNKSLGTPSAALLVVAVVVLMFTPGAWAQPYKTLYTFVGDASGQFPSGVIFDQAGNLYGTTGEGGGGPCDDGCGLAYKLTPNADGSWAESVLYTFCSVGGCADGFYPYAGLTLDQSGNLYGETYLGGGAAGCDCGTVFELTPSSNGSWTEKVIYHFTDGADGGLPIGGLIFDQAGNLYGTTYGGGIGYGVIFELTPNADGSWTEKVLHNSKGAGGESPLNATLIFDHAGNLYGTASGGDSKSCGDGEGCGVVFELSPNSDGSWEEKVLHRFTGADGAFPGAGVIFDQAGNLYGTTEEGGNPTQCVDEGVGCGAIFQLIPNADGSWKETILHHFTGGKDGGLSFAPLIFDKSGNLYGTTEVGGKPKLCAGDGFSGGCGVVFKLQPNSKGGWNETVLHRFVRDPGAYPQAGVIFDAAGNLYGTTQGDSNGCSDIRPCRNTFGSVFEITP